MSERTDSRPNASETIDPASHRPGRASGGPPPTGGPPPRDRPAREATDSPKRPRAGSALSADRVQAIIAAAEQAAEDMRLRTETRMRDRIAEGERAASNRVRAAEEEAAEIVKEAREDAERAKSDAASEALAIIAKAHDEADRTRNEAEQAKTAGAAEALEIVGRAHREARASVAQMKAQTLETLGKARIAAADVRSEGMELVENLREMGDALRSNSERLLRDVQAIHSRMVAQLDSVDGGASRIPTPRDAGPRRPRERGPNRPADADKLEVPEFMPPA